ncbi:MAG: thioredoxin family protein [Thermoguttaceae bacterium]|nr:thioredoxin family protein [Thermoguttaceae bacterium]
MKNQIRRLGCRSLCAGILGTLLLGTLIPQDTLNAERFSGRRNVRDRIAQRNARFYSSADPGLYQSRYIPEDAKTQNAQRSSKDPQTSGSPNISSVSSENLTSSVPQTPILPETALHSTQKLTDAELELTIPELNSMLAVPESESMQTAVPAVTGESSAVGNTASVPASDLVQLSSSASSNTESPNQKENKKKNAKGKKTSRIANAPKTSPKSESAAGSRLASETADARTALSAPAISETSETESERAAIKTSLDKTGRIDTAMAEKVSKNVPESSGSDDALLPHCWWFTNWEAARNVCIQTQRPLLIHFSTSYCGPCKKMEREVFSQEAIQTLAGKHFVMVKVDGQKQPHICSEFHVTAFPTDLILDAAGNELARFRGFQTASSYSAFLSEVIAQTRIPPMIRPFTSEWEENWGKIKQETARISAEEAQTKDVSAPAASPAPTANAVPQFASTEENLPISLAQETNISTTQATPITEKQGPALDEDPIMLASPALNTDLENEQEDDFSLRGQSRTGIQSEELPLNSQRETQIQARSPERAPNLDLFSLEQTDDVPPRKSSAVSAPSVELLEMERLDADSSQKDEEELMPIMRKPSSGYAPVSAHKMSAEEALAGASLENAHQNGKLQLHGLHDVPTDKNPLTDPPANDSRTTEDPPKVSMYVNENVMLDGYCPVALVERNIWVRGNSKFTLQHEGKTYFFQTEEELQKFQNDPEYYALVFSGLDIVLFANEKKAVPGSRKFGLRYQDRNYVFHSEENRNEFKKYPAYFIGQLRLNAAAERNSSIH